MTNNNKKLREIKLLELGVTAAVDDLVKINKAILGLYLEDDLDLIAKKYEELADKRNILESSIINSAIRVRKIHNEIKPNKEKELYT